MRIPRKISFVISVIVGALLLTASAVGQDGRPRGNAKPVTVPVTIRLRDAKPVEMRFVDNLCAKTARCKLFSRRERRRKAP